jgi:hypothetical protein
MLQSATNSPLVLDPVPQFSLIVKYPNYRHFRIAPAPQFEASHCEAPSKTPTPKFQSNRGGLGEA